MVSRKGQAIRFHETRVAPDGPRDRRRPGDAPARGRRGDRDQHRRATTPTCSSSPRTATASARAVGEYPLKGRGGLGVKTVQLTEAKGQLAGARVVRDGLPGDADLDRRHRDPDAGRGRQAARPRDPGRDRHAPARGETVSSLAPVVESRGETATTERRRRCAPARRVAHPPTSVSERSQNRCEAAQPRDLKGMPAWRSADKSTFWSR